MLNVQTRNGLITAPRIMISNDRGERRREKPDESLRRESERDGNDGVESRLLRRSFRGMPVRAAQDQHAEHYRDKDKRARRNRCGRERQVQGACMSSGLFEVDRLSHLHRNHDPHRSRYMPQELRECE
jgi:hypothetical protein